MASITLTVLGMSCVGCARSVEKALAKLGGVAKAQVDLSARKVTVSFDPQRTNPDEIAQTINKAGYRAQELPRE